MALSRVVRINSRHRVELRAEAFNVTNRVHLDNPNTVYGNAKSAASSARSRGCASCSSR